MFIWNLWSFEFQEPEDSELTDEHESPHPEEGVGTYPPRPAGSSPQPVEKEKGKEKEEKETDKDKEKEKQEKPENQEVPPKPHVQNNQVNTSQSQQPIPPSNQINNQLNNQQPDTGEEEGSSNSNNKTSPAPAEWLRWLNSVIYFSAFEICYLLYKCYVLLYIGVFMSELFFLLLFFFHSFFPQKFKSMKQLNGKVIFFSYQISLSKILNAVFILKAFLEN